MKRLAVLTLLLTTAALAEEKTLKAPDGGALKVGAQPVGVVHVSSGAKWLVATSAGGATVFSLPSFEKKLSIAKAWPEGFSPDGALLAVGEGSAVSVYDLASGTKLLSKIGRYGSGEICVSRSNKLVACAYELRTAIDKDNEHNWHAGVFQVKDGDDMRDLGIGAGPAGVLGFGPEDEEVFTWRWERFSNTDFSTAVVAHSLKTGEQRIVKSPPKQRGLGVPRLSPAGDRLVWSTQGELTLTDAKTDQVLWSVEDVKSSSVHFSPDGERLVAAAMDKSGEAVLFDAKSGKKLAAVTLPEPSYEVALVGDFLLSGTKDGKVVFTELKR